MKNKILTDFAVGLIIGVLFSVVILGLITGKYFYWVKQKELIENVQRQQAINELQEEISNLDYLDLLDTFLGVGTAADTAAIEFERKRDEILQRFRGRMASRASLAD